LTFDVAGALTAENPGGRNLAINIPPDGRTARLHGIFPVKELPDGTTLLVFIESVMAAVLSSAVKALPGLYGISDNTIRVRAAGRRHQPVEQVAALRAVPGLIVLRPADAAEAVEAWRVVMQLHHEPAALVLTRQAVPTIDRSRYASASGVSRGAYVLADAV